MFPTRVLKPLKQFSRLTSLRFLLSIHSVNRSLILVNFIDYSIKGAFADKSDTRLEYICILCFSVYASLIGLRKLEVINFVNNLE